MRNWCARVSALMMIVSVLLGFSLETSSSAHAAATNYISNPTFVKGGGGWSGVSTSTNCATSNNNGEPNMGGYISNTLIFGAPNYTVSQNVTLNTAGMYQFSIYGNLGSNNGVFNILLVNMWQMAQLSKLLGCCSAANSRHSGRTKAAQVLRTLRIDSNAKSIQGTFNS